MYVIGLGEGLWGAVTGTLEAIADPVNTLKGAGAVIARKLDLRGGGVYCAIAVVAVTDTGFIAGANDLNLKPWRQHPCLTKGDHGGPG